MIKKIISILICILITASACISLCSCSKDIMKDQFPVTVNGVTIEKEPENVVVLSPNFADIIAKIGYDVKMVGRSVETDQEFLRVVPTVGPAKNPTITTIVSSETDLVIADDSLESGARSMLEEAGIQLLIMEDAATMEALETLYTDLGTALGGKTIGAEKGKEGFDDLFETLDTLRSVVKKNTIKTCSYLYFENQKLHTFEKGSIEENVFSYNAALNILKDNESSTVDIQTIKMATPTYIFVSDERTKAVINTDPELQNSAVVRNKNIYVIPKEDFYRQGRTFEDVVFNMIDIMFVQSRSSKDEATPLEASTTEYISETQTESVSNELTADFGDADFEDDEADIIGGD